jgi:hypothetical protein
MDLRHRTGIVTVLATVAMCMLNGGSASASTPTGALPPSPPNCAALAPRLAPEAWPVLERELLPRGAAVLRLCRYGPSLPRLRPRYSRLIRSQGEVQHFEKEMDALPEVPPNAPPSPCPVGNGASIWVYASYFGAHYAKVRIPLGGCRFARNGDLVASANEGPGQHPSRLGPRLIAELEALTGCVPIPICERFPLA